MLPDRQHVARQRPDFDFFIALASSRLVSSRWRRVRDSSGDTYSNQGSPGLRGIFGSGSACGRSRFERDNVVQPILM